MMKGVVGTLSVFGANRIVRRRMNGLLSVSTFVESKMQAHLLSGAPKFPRMTVIPDWRTDERTVPSESRLLDLLPRQPFILFVGALRRVKGINQLIAAYSRLRRRPPLVLIGMDAPDTPTIPAEVTVLHDLPAPMVLAAWRRAMFGVAPSTLPEPLGNVIHEAMSQGRPVIGTTPGGHREMIEPWRNGLLVPSGDVEALAAAMQTLIDDPGLRERLGEDAFVAAQAFSRERVVPKLIDFLEKIAQDSTHQR